MILGINFSSIRASVGEEKPSENVTINSTPRIIGMAKRELLEMKDVLEIKFAFETTYEPSIGSIAIEGEVLWRGPDAKRILKEWEDKQRIEPKFAVEILNAIFRRCLTKAIELASDLRLPPPIRFPVVTEKK
jgi:hypothetical protein